MYFYLLEFGDVNVFDFFDFVSSTFAHFDFEFEINLIFLLQNLTVPFFKLLMLHSQLYYILSYSFVDLSLCLKVFLIQFILLHHQWLYLFVLWFLWRVKLNLGQLLNFTSLCVQSYHLSLLIFFHILMCWLKFLQCLNMFLHLL